jgi:hypothetical protein
MTPRLIAPTLAVLALATAQTAAAQEQACVRAADLGDAVVYAMPIAYDAVRNACANRLARDGFMATKGDAFAGNFRSRQSAAWPGAFRLLKTFMANDSSGGAGTGNDMIGMISSLPEESLRPFVDGLIGQMIAGEIKGDDCGKIERGVELISPLPTDNVAGLFAFIAEMADLKNPAICPAASGAKKK